jgi:multidrug transporter EmrE-like cation transporter
MQTLYIFFLIFLSTVFTVAGQLFFRKGMLDVGEISFSLPSLWKTLGGTASNIYVIGGFIFFALGAIWWLVVLSKVEVSYAYPIGSLGYILLLFASWLFLGESIPLYRWIGVFLICLGIFFIARG